MHALIYKQQKLPVKGDFVKAKGASPLVDRITLTNRLAELFRTGDPVTSTLAATLEQIFPEVQVKEVKELTAQLHNNGKIIVEVNITEAHSLKDLLQLACEQCEDFDEEDYEEALRLINGTDKVTYE